MSLQLADKFTIRGVLELTGTHAHTGEQLLYYKEDNVITIPARSMVNYACAGKRQIDPVTQLAVGNGGYHPGAPNSNIDPPAPDENDSSLKMEIYRKNVLPVQHSTLLSSIFEIELGPLELLNHQISECGLFTHGNMLFARRTFRPVSKIENMILGIRWTLLF